ncbi:unnamed protein product [[Candida] boidinii]|uniref:Unnamed protein product n=1 Tax=Candida boidinii TaxID=5477 RepID=A0ACB5THY4_CANBO|nr:unnamed protein product [[Candida] boidinii]
MKFEFSLLVLIFAKLLVAANAADNDMICPDDNPDNCYPKVFVPTNEWQEIKPEQHIPAGLHVRMNIDNMGREAKLPEKSTNSQINKEIQAIAVDGDVNNAVVAVGEVHDTEENTNGANVNDQNKKRSNGSRGKPAPGELLNALKGVEEFSNNDRTDNIEDIMAHLEILDDLSHDIDYGVDISKNPMPLIQLTGIYTFGQTSIYETKLKGKTTDSLKIQDMSMRVLSSTIRNNDEALDNIVELFNGSKDKLYKFIMEKLEKLNNNSFENIIQRRRLGLLNSILGHEEIASSFCCLSNDLTLLHLYSKITDKESKNKIINILHDLRNAPDYCHSENIVNLSPQDIQESLQLKKRYQDDNSNISESVIVDEDDEEAFGDITDVDLKYSIVAQRMIRKYGLTNNFKAREILQDLIDLKKNKKNSLKISSRFLNWIEYQIDQVKQLNNNLSGSNNGEGDDDNQQRFIIESRDGKTDFQEYLISARHEIFGNSHAGRKASADEL